jgi:hypothetical protein
VAAAPQWELLGVPHVAELPAVRWKLENLERLRQEDPAKFRLQHDLLAGRFANLPVPGA